MRLAGREGLLYNFTIKGIGEEGGATRGEVYRAAGVWK